MSNRIAEIFSEEMGRDGGAVDQESPKLAKLVGKRGGFGEVVHQTQVMAKEDGFKCVNKSWFDKCLTYDQGMKQLEAQKEATEDLLIPVSQVVPMVNNAGDFVLRFPDGREFSPTPFAAKQLGRQDFGGLGTFPMELLYNRSTFQAVPGKKKGYKKEAKRDREDMNLMVHMVENGWRRLDPKRPYLFRVNKSDNTLRVMLTDQYQCLDNRWLLEILKEVIPGGRLSHWRGDADAIYGNLLLPDSIREESDSDYGALLSLSNSEIGTRILSTTPSIFRAICFNGNIWSEEKGVAFTRRHNGKTVDLFDLKEKIKENLHAQIPLLPQGIDKLLNTRKLAWDGESIRPLFAQLAGQEKLSKSIATSLLYGYADEIKAAPATKRTAFSVINAVTRASQKQDNQGWVDLDRLGGRIMTGGESYWETLTGRAKSLKSEEVDSAFATA
jgi:hypothetical protein